jgi:hypothetical protein
MNDYIDEGLLPMNFNFNNRRNINGQDNQFNPSINPNDPMVQAELTAKKKRDEESAKQQRIANYTQYARNIIYKIMNCVNNIVVGHRSSTFSEANEELLCISIENKIYELLRENKLYIDNNIFIRVINEMQYFAKEEYQSNIKRYNLQYTNKVAFNNESRTLFVNPDFSFGIIIKWINENFAHNQYDDQIILS